MSTLALTNGEIESEIGHLLGISRTASEWDTTTTADVDRAIRSGRRRFFSANRWKFLITDEIINTVAPFSSGSVTVAAGVVTLVGAVFPSDAENYQFVPTGGGVYSIASRDSDTQITLDDTSVTNATADTTFNLYKFKYAMNANFGGWEGPVTVGNAEGAQVVERRNLPEFELRSFANMRRPRIGSPTMFSVTSTPDSETGIAAYKMTLYPLPDKVYSLATRYRISPGDTLALADSVAVTDPVFTECYLESILAAVEILAFDRPGPHTQRFQQLLPEAVAADNAMAGIRHGRKRFGKSARPRYLDLINGTVDITDQIIT